MAILRATFIKNTIAGMSTDRWYSESYSVPCSYGLAGCPIASIQLADKYLSWNRSRNTEKNTMSPFEIRAE